MGTYTGTVSKDTITPGFLSAGVTAVPSGTTPSEGIDTINGLDGGDTIDGGGGNDTIIDASPLRGGFHGPNAGNVIAGGRGNDIIAIKVLDTGGLNPAGNAASGGDGDDTVGVEIGDFDNVLDELWVGQAPSGSVSLSGGTGNDLLEVLSFGIPTGGVSTSLYGNDGADTLRATAVMYDPDGSRAGGNNTDRLYGGAGNDAYRVKEAQDLVIETAGQGTDTVVADDIDYVLPANVENLTMAYYYYPSKADYTGIGNTLNNVIAPFESAYEPPNYLFDGLAGDDTLVGGIGNDSLNGGPGNDTVYGKQAGSSDFGYYLDADTIHGGDGNDLIYGAGSGSDTWDGDDLIYGDAGNDTLHGVIGNDAMFGGDGTDLMFGGEGNDAMDGGLGNDDVRGQNGADTLIGGGGLDRLMGGAGNDTFDYNAVTDSRAGATLRDVITTAFDGVGAAAGDKIDLATIDANAGIGGNQAFAFRGTAAFTGAGQLRVAASGTDTLIQANTGGTLAADLEILVKDGAILPTAWQVGDFIV
jgi:Ca2+-binding RTX toxin-like protein